MYKKKTPIVEDGKDILPINFAAIKSICSDENVIKGVVAAILEDGPQSIELIEQAIKAQNSEDVRLYAHRIKGAAMTVGAERLSQKAYRLECAGEDKNIAAAALLLDDIREEFEKVAAFLSQPDWIEIAKDQENNKQRQ